MGKRKPDSDSESDDEDLESSSAASSSSSSSSSDKKKKKKKKDKKSKKDKKEKKKEKKKKKKDKEKKRKRDAEKLVSSEAYGTYGIINEQDQYRMRPEFMCWLLEVKKIPGGIEAISNVESKIYFKDFCEDFNTATFKSKKYYDLEKWEKEQRKKNAAFGMVKKQKVDVFSDDKARQDEIKAIQEKNRNAALGETYARMKTDDRGLIKDMREQEAMQQQVKDLFKQGRTEEARRLARRIDPENLHAK